MLLRKGRHGLEARQPIVGVKVARVSSDVRARVGEPAVAVRGVAAPARMRDVVVEYDCYAVIVKRGDDARVRGDERRAGEEGIERDGLGVERVERRLGDACLGSGGSEGLRYGGTWAERHVDRVRQADAGEARVGDEGADRIDRLVLQALGGVRLHVARPARASEFETRVVGVYDPAARGVEDSGAVGRETGWDERKER